MKKTVLFAGFPEAELLSIYKVILPLGYRGLKVKPEDYSKPLGVLLSLDQESSFQDAGNLFTDVRINRFLVMAGFESTDINLLLAAFRKNHIASIPYKAILTPTNRFWKLSDLYAEIQKEHESMQQMNKKE